MIDYEKLRRMEAQVARMADARRSRSERYRDRIAQSKELRSIAVYNAQPDCQSMPLAELLKLSEPELQEAGVDCKLIRLAALERRLADDELRTTPTEESEFAALSALARNCRVYAGEDQ